MLTAVLLIVGVALLCRCGMTAISIGPLARPEVDTAPPVDISRKVLTTGAQGKAGVNAYRRHFILYSAAGFANAAIPQETLYFNYKIGDNPVSGTGQGAVAVRATRYHTNLIIGGQLPSPELFTIYGIGLHMPAIDFSTAAPTNGEAVPGQAVTFSTSATKAGLVLEDLKKIFNSCTFRLNVGAKFYCEHPLYLLPGNYGFGGLAGVSEDNAGATAIQHQDVQLPHAEGIGYALFPFMVRSNPSDPNSPLDERGPVVIAEGQSFLGSLRCNWTTNPSLGAHRLLFALLHGEIVRAAQ